MHDLKMLLTKLTGKSPAKNLSDQQSHLEALWNHLCKKAEKRLYMLKRQCENEDSNPGLQIPTEDVTEFQYSLIDWLKKLKESMVKYALIPNVLHCKQSIDIRALKLLSTVGNQTSCFPVISLSGLERAHC